MREVQGAAEGHREQYAEKRAHPSWHDLGENQQHAADECPPVDVGRQSSSQFAVMAESGGALEQVAALDIAILG